MRVVTAARRLRPAECIQPSLVDTPFDYSCCLKLPFYKKSWLVSNGARADQEEWCCLCLASREALPVQAVLASLPLGPGTGRSPHLDGFSRLLPSLLALVTPRWVTLVQPMGHSALEHARSHGLHNLPVPCSVGCCPPGWHLTPALLPKDT